MESKREFIGLIFAALSVQNISGHIYSSLKFENAGILTSLNYTELVIPLHISKLTNKMDSIEVQITKIARSKEIRK